VGDLREFQLPGGGLNCGHCGGTLTRVFRTITTQGFITRERICPCCGKINTTSERVLNVRDRRSSFNDKCE
jgi:transcriptional regulator NrdR family protein